jgi:hypothetical protein
MRWVEEPNKHNPKSPYQALITEADEPLTLAFVEYWKRLLNDGIQLPPADRYSLAMEIVARKFRDDPSPGNLRASFHNSLKRQSDGVPIYRLHGNYFECVQGEKEDDRSFGGRHLVWLLALARKIREARTNAKRGDIFTANARRAFRDSVRDEFQGANARNARTTIRQGAPLKKIHLHVNEPYPDGVPFTTVPPTLLLKFPKLPDQVAYRIVGRDLILLDVEANLVIDTIPEMIPLSS